MYCLWLGPPNGDLEPEMLKLTSSHICTLIATYLEASQRTTVSRKIRDKTQTLAASDLASQ